MDAINLIESEVTRRWTKANGTRRLTQAGRAELLGLSIPTTDKLMKGEPVDRNVLKDAFRQIGLEWSETLVIQEEHSSCDEFYSQVQKSQLTRSWKFVIPLVALVAVTWAVLGMRQASSTQWKEEFDHLFNQSEDEYNRAQYSQARSTTERAMDLANIHRSPEKAANALFMAGKIESAAGSLKKARSLFLQALTIREAFNDDLARSPILERLGDVELRLGNLDAARNAFDRAADGFQREGHTMGVAESTRGKGSVCYQQGAYLDALKHYDSSLAMVPTEQRADFEADIRGLRALVHSAMGKHDLARKELQASLEHWRELNHPRWMASTELKLARIEVRASNAAAAKVHLRKARSGYQAVGDRSGLLKVAEIEAQIGV